MHLSGDSPRLQAFCLSITYAFSQAAIRRNSIELWSKSKSIEIHKGGCMPVQRNRQRDANKGRSSTGSRRGARSSSKRSNDMGSKDAKPKQMKYSKWIDSPEEHEDRKGQSLATRNHDVIRQWTQSRKAVPSVVGDTEGRAGAGVLRIDFPGYG